MVGIVFGKQNLQGDGCEDSLDFRFLLTRLGDRHGVDFESRLTHIDLKLLYECLAEWLALPVFEVAVEYTLENTAQIIGYLVGEEPEYKHEHSKAACRVVEIARALEFVEKPLHEAVLLFFVDYLKGVAVGLYAVDKVGELLLECPALLRLESIEET